MGGLGGFALLAYVLWFTAQRAAAKDTRRTVCVRS